METKPNKILKTDWEKLYGLSITNTEYGEICANINGFFSILRHWDKEKVNNYESEKN
jgi:hypothetical protein